jgi:hypothetical protein
MIALRATSLKYNKLFPAQTDYLTGQIVCFRFIFHAFAFLRFNLPLLNGFPELT